MFHLAHTSEPNHEAAEMKELDAKLLLVLTEDIVQLFLKLYITLNIGATLVWLEAFSILLSFFGAVSGIYSYSSRIIKTEVFFGPSNYCQWSCSIILLMSVIVWFGCFTNLSAENLEYDRSEWVGDNFSSMRSGEAGWGV